MSQPHVKISAIAALNIHCTTQGETRKLRPKVEATVFLKAACPAEQLAENWSTGYWVRIPKVPSEGVGRGDDSKMPRGIFTTSDARRNETRRARFFFRSSFLRRSL